MGGVDEVAGDTGADVLGPVVEGDDLAPDAHVVGRGGLGVVGALVLVDPAAEEHHVHRGVGPGLHGATLNRQLGVVEDPALGVAGAEDVGFDDLAVDRVAGGVDHLIESQALDLGQAEARAGQEGQDTEGEGFLHRIAGGEGRGEGTRKQGAVLTQRERLRRARVPQKGPSRALGGRRRRVYPQSGLFGWLSDPESAARRGARAQGPPGSSPQNRALGAPVAHGDDLGVEAGACEGPEGKAESLGAEVLAEQVAVVGDRDRVVARGVLAVGEHVGR